MRPDSSLLTRFVDVALTNVSTEYPYHLVHLVQGADDVRPPRALYPIFHGSYDWHSSVHMHWSLARAIALAPRAEFVPRVLATFDERFTDEHVAGEARYFEAPGHATFERPYGWAWLLLLATELRAVGQREPCLARAGDALAPLAALLRARTLAWLAQAEFPTRAGTHGNAAFALVLTAAYADAYEDLELIGKLAAAARRWYGADRAYPAEYEPSGDDFLSGGLCEALALARLVPRAEFEAWWRAFEPSAAGLARWSAPVGVSDPDDPKIVHLAGLNLSRAWCWRELAPALPGGLAERAADAAARHLAASLPAATAGHYVGTHWLASFALLALSGERPALGSVTNPWRA